MSLRELGDPSLVDALAYLELLAELKPGKLERAAVRWHGRLETETPLAAGEREAIEILRRLLIRVRPSLVPQMSSD